MANEYEAAKVFTTLEVRGQDDVKRDLDDNQRRAEDAKRKMIGIVQKPQTPADMIRTISSRTGEKQEDIARALGIRNFTQAAMPRPNLLKEKPAEVSKLIEGMGASSAKSRMIEGMSGAGFEASRDAKEKAAAENLVTQQAKEEAKAKLLLNKQTAEVTKGFERFGSAAFGSGAGKLISAATSSNPMFAALGISAAIDAAAINRRANYIEESRSNVALARPALGIQQEYLDRDIAALKGRMQEPGFKERMQNDMMRRDALAQAQKQGGFAGFVMDIKNKTGADWLDKKFQDMLGVGPPLMERMLAGKNPGGGMGAAPNPMLGETMAGGDDLYSAFAKAALQQTPGKDFNDAVDKFAAAVERLESGALGKAMTGIPGPVTPEMGTLGAAMHGTVLK